MLDINLGNSTGPPDHLCCSEKQLMVIIFMTLFAVLFTILLLYNCCQWYCQRRRSRYHGYIDIDSGNPISVPLYENQNPNF